MSLRCHPNANRHFLSSYFNQPQYFPTSEKPPRVEEALVGPVCRCEPVHAFGEPTTTQSARSLSQVPSCHLDA